MHHFNVIIIGAGPAGLNCAKHLENSGKSILILEKSNEIGPKVCAGGLTQKDIDYLNYPERLLSHKFSKIYYITPRQKTKVSQDKPFVYTTDRKILGQWQLTKLHSDQIKIKTNSTVEHITDKTIRLTSGEEISYDHLVGADGSVSLVRRFLKIPTENIGVGIQYIVKDTKYKNLELHYNNKLFKNWYAWIFPQDGFTSIGTGGDPRIIPMKTMRNNFEIWLKNNNINIEEAKFEAFPINYDYRGLKFNNIYLTGDAAGLASEFNGEGIYQALISGEEVAKLIIDETHQLTKLEEVLKLKARHARILKIITKFGPLRTALYEFIKYLFKSEPIKNKLLNKVLF